MNDEHLEQKMEREHKIQLADVAAERDASVNRLVQDLAECQRQLSEARKDSDRINWLELPHSSEFWLSLMGEPCIRQTIDAARAAQPA